MESSTHIHFEIQERKILLRILDLFFALLGLFALEQYFGNDYLVFSNSGLITWISLIAYLTIFGTVFEIYDIKKASNIDDTFQNVLLTVAFTSLFYLLTPIITPVLPSNRIQIVGFFGAILIPIFLWRIGYILLVASPRFHKRVLLIGEYSNLSNVLNAFKDVDQHYQIVGFVNCETEAVLNHKSHPQLKIFKIEDVLEVIKSQKISEVVVTNYNTESISPELYNNLIQLLESGFSIREFTQVYEELTQRVPVQFVGKDFYKYFPFNRSHSNKLYQLLSRVFDIVFSVAILIVFIVILPLVLIGNLIGNRGPLLYKQIRVGENGKLFHIIKLRSMIENAESQGAQWASKDDHRITAFGRFLRNSRLDEVPQLVNVIKGEMSVIGPRPERPVFVKELSKQIPFYETRHILKPGMTGWAQVNERYGDNVVEDSLTKLQYDLYYIKHRNFFLDVNIITKTISTVLYYRGQ